MKKPLSIQINIPEPCHEDWNTMSPCEHGRFCAHCQKKVIDFTTWSDTALFQFFSKNEAPVCGRFSTYQIDRPINIPHQPHSRLYRIAVGLGLVLIFTQAPEANARTRAPFVMEQLVDNPGDKNDSTGTGTISGQVVDTAGQPVIGAVIELTRSGMSRISATTDYDGNYTIKDASAGVYNVCVSYTGYESVLTRDIKIKSGQTIKLSATLKDDPNPHYLTGAPVSAYYIHSDTIKYLNSIPKIPSSKGKKKDPK